MKRTIGLWAPCTGLALLAGTLVAGRGALAATGIALPIVQCLSGKSVEMVIDTCSQGLKLPTTPGNRAQMLQKRADAYLESDLPEKALADYSDLLVLARSAAALEGRGRALRALGRFSEAMQNVNAAIELAPKSAFVYQTHGNIFWDQKNYSEAADDFSRAIALDAKHGFRFADRALMYHELGRYADALKDYQTALGLDPNFLPFLKRRVQTLMAVKDLAAAQADLATIKAMAPEDGDTPKIAAQLAKLEGATSQSMLENLKIPVDAGKSGPVDDPRKTDPSGTSIFDSLVVKRPPAAAPQAPGKDAAVLPPGITSQTRVALVIGNGAYQHVPGLTNPASDSALIAKTLRELGFTDVVEAHDLTREGLVAAIRAFESKTLNADWSVVYFAGHGIEVAGQNYIIPVDATLKSERDVQDETISLSRLLTALEGTRGLKLVVLDACRDNPFASQMKRTDGTRSVTRGLARIEPSGSVLVAYAAKGGETAQDGAAGNSPFATALALRLVERNVEINKVFRLVRDDVLKATQKRQEPFVYGSLGSEDYYFNPVR